MAWTDGKQIGKPKREEDAAQAAAVVWMQKLNIPHYAVPNGAKRTLAAAVRLKSTGLVAGIPDLVIPVARRGFHHLYIEMKREKGGHVSDQQKYWLAALTQLGHYAVIARGFEDFKRIVSYYFNNDFRIAELTRTQRL
jgi:hypothetical protein